MATAAFELELSSGLKHATGDLFKRKQDVFGTDCPVAELKGIMRRHRMTVGKCFEDAARQVCSGGIHAQFR
jgi:hypothetical protein